MSCFVPLFSLSRAMLVISALMIASCTDVSQDKTTLKNLPPMAEANAVEAGEEVAADEASEEALTEESGTEEQEAELAEQIVQPEEAELSDVVDDSEEVAEAIEEQETTEERVVPDSEGQPPKAMNLAVPRLQEMMEARPSMTKGASAEDLFTQALAEAYIKNPELEAQRKSFQSTVEQVPQALAGALPSANIDYAKGRQRTRQNGGQWGFADTLNKSLRVNQPLFRGGSTYANTKAARRTVEAAIARLTQVEQQVLLQAATAYMDVVRATAVLRLSEKNRDVLARQLEAATQRFEVGEDTRTDVAQSEARLALAKAEVINSRSGLASARAAYQDVVGTLPKHLKAPKSLPDIPSNLDVVVDQALENNPQITEAVALKESANQQVNSNIGQLLPAVDLEGSMSRQDGVGIFGTNSFDQDSVQVRASMPLYTGGQRYSQIRQAKETYQQRRFQLLDQENNVRQQAVAAWEDYQAATGAIESNRTAIEAAQIALEGVRQEQQYGARTTLEVLDAERELFNAEVQLVSAERNRVVAAYTVLAVLGKLTAQSLNLPITYYDAEEYYDDTEYQIIGF